MTILTFIKFAPVHFDLYKEWSMEDTIHPWFGDPIPEWFDYVMTTAFCFTWMIYDKDIPVAHLEVGLIEDDHSQGQISIMVAPHRQRKGYGRRILIRMLTRKELANVKRFYAFIKPENVASVSLFTVIGLTTKMSEVNEQGYFEYELVRG